jgi:hypothetical protein
MKHVVCVLGFLCLAVAMPSSARAADLQLALGAYGGGTDWKGDGVAASTFKVGVRGWDRVAPYFLARIGYGSVDSRLVTMLSLGAQVWGRLGTFRPYARFGFAHQHEEPLAYVGRNKLGALFGVGDGIRHRAGLDGAAGFDLPVRRWTKAELYLNVEGTTSWFMNSSGPSWFWGGGVALGLNYQI